MVSTKRRQIQFLEQEEEKPLHKRRALQLLDSYKIRERLKGYALLTTCFHLCSTETKDYIRKKWKQETELNKTRKGFINYCTKIFSR